MPKLNEFIDLADGWGIKKPIIGINQIIFNGRADCGHEHHELGITWPSKMAGGIAVPYKENVKDGTWFAGATLEKRMCGGDCSHESFIFEKNQMLKDWDKPDEDEGGLYFKFCKTAFKPYDLAVITFLIIAKRHLKEMIRVHSDGNDNQWFDGKMLCQTELGYGLEYQVNKKGHLENNQ